MRTQAAHKLAGRHMHQGAGVNPLSTGAIISADFKLEAKGVMLDDMNDAEHWHSDQA